MIELEISYLCMILAYLDFYQNTPGQEKLKLIPVQLIDFTRTKHWYFEDVGLFRLMKA